MSPLPEPVRASAAASSSTKNGTPSVRSWIALASAGAGGLPSVSASSAAVSASSSGASDNSPRWPPRRSSLRRRRTPWSRGRPSERYAATTSTGSSSSAGASADSSSRVPSSDHCRSSSRTSTWRPRATCANAHRTASNRVARSLAGAGSPSSGRISARCGRNGPQPERPSGAARRYERRAATTGPYGAVPPWLALAWSTSASVPSASSAANRVLPTPASPLMSSTEPRPDRACSSAASSRSSSARRPTSPLLALMRGVYGGGGSEIRHARREITAIQPMCARRSERTVAKAIDKRARWPGRSSQ